MGSSFDLLEPFVLPVNETSSCHEAPRISDRKDNDHDGKSAGWLSPRELFLASMFFVKSFPFPTLLWQVTQVGKLCYDLLSFKGLSDYNHDPTLLFLKQRADFEGTRDLSLDHDQHGFFDTAAIILIVVAEEWHCIHRLLCSTAIFIFHIVLCTWGVMPPSQRRNTKKIHAAIV